jgi:hypothetical protein
MKTKLLLLVVCLFCTSSALAGPNAPADDPDAMPSEKLTVTAAAEPSPALRYSLFPTIGERTPGNAAPYYYRALLMMRQDVSDSMRKEYAEKSEQWNDLPFDKMPREEMQKYVDAHAGALRQLRTATYREYCDFDLRVQDLRGTETIAFLLPEFQEMRNLARVLRLKARLQLADGKFDEALDTLRMGYQLAVDTAQPPFLINALIGGAIGGTMNAVVREWIDTPGSPNLYWALAALPRPLVDMRRAMEYEMNLPLQMFPFLKDAETANRGPDEWQRLIADAIVDLIHLDNGRPSPGAVNLESQLLAAAMVAKAYPAAKKALIEEGFTAERVEKMPVGQVVAIQAARSSRQSYHDLFKWSLLPYAVAKPFAARAEEHLKDLSLTDAGIPLARMLLPAISAVGSAQIRSQRDIAALIDLEAIRMHAAATGKLPASLAEIAIVPTLNNPATDQPFIFLNDGRQVTLGVPPVNSRDGRWYVLQLEPKAK